MGDNGFDNFVLSLSSLSVFGLRKEGGVVFGGGGVSGFVE